MIEVLARDGWARRARWTLGATDVETPVVLYVDTDRHPAPAHAKALLARRAPAGDRPWVQDLGSRFSPLAPAPGAAVSIAPELPYAPASGADLLAAGHAENEGALAKGQALVAIDPRAAMPTDASDLVVMGSARALVANPYALAAHVTTLRRSVGAGRLLYAPGCGLPHEMALLAYAGIDVFDSSAALLAARQGQYLTPEGPMDAAAVERAGARPCRCDACVSGATGFDWLTSHALAAVETERARVAAAIEAGRLRDLVETRIRATPEMAAHLRRFDLEHHDHFEERAPLIREGVLAATSKESLQRPEVERFRRRIESRYRKPESARVLLLLPCSARKPYSESRTHRRIAEWLERVPGRAAVHEVIVTSPLGVVPRELERVYPAAQYDLPVTGHWDEDERAMIRGALDALLERNKYDRVIVHLDETEMEIVAPVLTDFEHTVEGDPLSNESLGALVRALNDATADGPRVTWRDRMADDLAAVASWQFGEAGRSLAEGATARGKTPFVRLFDGETQLAMLTDRGLLSLTLDGGRRLLERGAYRVEIEDFVPKGSVFCVGVKGADREVRPGDEVVLHHAGDIRGVGRAALAGSEMTEVRRGVAVVGRHHVAAKEARK
ncbi:MAG TPA: archaeosine synthase subunit alpha [Candidatus Thermoplasmatota archaeon]|nr:archaeosine synthase subunit alpha [Candidatus Thermoplasmatota archaeon]